MRLWQYGSESLKDAEFGQQRAAIVHIHFVFAGPMECFAWKNLEALEVDAMAFVKLDVTLGKIIADDSDELNWTEKAGGNGGVTGRTAQQARVFCFGSFNGIEGSRADNQDTHFFVESLNR